MFTGIIKAIGTLSYIQKDARHVFLVTSPEIAERVQLGSSVCVSGVCLTVKEIQGGTMHFDVMPETRKKTTLESWDEGRKVHLEPSLRAGDELGGHFVYGHVDEVAEVIEVANDVDATLLTFQASKELMKSIVSQGSVAIDGVSLTVAKLAEDSLTVSLVPHTLRETTLKDLKKGDRVNVEVDMLVKIVKSKG
jgi:riboflavin synthase